MDETKSWPWIPNNIHQIDLDPISIIFQIHHMKAQEPASPIQGSSSSPQKSASSAMEASKEPSEVIFRSPFVSVHM